MIYARGKPGHVPHFSANGQLVKSALQDGEVIIELEAMPEQHSIISSDGTILVPVVPDTDALWQSIRAERTIRLQFCDWTQFRDVPETTAAKWAPYRQALRDVTKQTDPTNIIWPTKPE